MNESARRFAPEYSFKGVLSVDDVLFVAAVACVPGKGVSSLIASVAGTFASGDGALEDALERVGCDCMRLSEAENEVADDMSFVKDVAVDSYTS